MNSLDLNIKFATEGPENKTLAFLDTLISVIQPDSSIKTRDHESYVNSALAKCAYPNGPSGLLKKQYNRKTRNLRLRNQNLLPKSSKGSVAIPYVKGFSELMSSQENL